MVTLLRNQKYFCDILEFSRGILTFVNVSDPRSERSLVKRGANWHPLGRTPPFRFCVRRASKPMCRMHIGANE